MAESESIAEYQKRVEQLLRDERKLVVNRSAPIVGVILLVEAIVLLGVFGWVASKSPETFSPFAIVAGIVALLGVGFLLYRWRLEIEYGGEWTFRRGLEPYARVSRGQSSDWSVVRLERLYRPGTKHQVGRYRHIILLAAKDKTFPEVTLHRIAAPCTFVPYAEVKKTAAELARRLGATLEELSLPAVSEELPPLEEPKHVKVTAGDAGEVVFTYKNDLGLSRVKITVSARGVEVLSAFAKKDKVLGEFPAGSLHTVVHSNEIPGPRPNPACLLFLSDRPDVKVPCEIPGADGLWLVHALRGSLAKAIDASNSLA